MANNAIIETLKFKRTAVSGKLPDVLNSANTSRLYITLPAVDDVDTGVVYGNQDSLTGTSTGGGGGSPTYYTHG